MDFDTFIDRVEEQGSFTDRDEAVRVTEATLATLGETIYRTERSNLGAQLPKPLAHALVAVQDPENSRHDVEPFQLDEFYNRVSDRSGVGNDDAEAYVPVVMGVLQEAVSDGEIEDLVNELPDEYRALFNHS